MKKLFIFLTIIVIWVIILSFSGCISPPEKGNKTDTVAVIGYSGLDNMTGVIILINDYNYWNNTLKLCKESNSKNDYCKNLRHDILYTFSPNDKKLMFFLEEAYKNQRTIKIYYGIDAGFFPNEWDGQIFRAEYT